MVETLKMIRDYCDEQVVAAEQTHDICVNKIVNKTEKNLFDYKAICSLNGKILAYEDVIDTIELIALEKGVTIDEEEGEPW